MLQAQPTLMIATRNAGKAAEFAEMFADYGLACRALSDYPEAGDVEETGATFRANACLKASQYATRLNCWALADDSGLEVDALSGAPGVYSARFAVMHNAGEGDLANNALLLDKLRDIPDDQRGARFVCVLALSNPAGQIVLTTRGTVKGSILHAPRGTNGFGYDPLFLISEMNQTTAELSSAEKHRISHRGRALREMKMLLSRVNFAS